MKQVRIIVGKVAYVIEEVEGEPQIRKEGEPHITRDRHVLTSYGRIEVEKIA